MLLFRASALRKLLQNKTKVLAVATAAAASVSAATFVGHQRRQKISGSCEFSDHTRTQHQKHFLSGMHEPFITKRKKELELFHQHFPELSHLLPDSVEKLKQQHAVKTPVKIRPLAECPLDSGMESVFLAVGGPPALMAAVASLEAGHKVVYICDERKWPIANGSAWHIEEDADAEAPTTYSPMTFMANQILRAVYNRENYEQIERTGRFPWRTLDWIGYAKNPGQWLPSLRVAFAFQLKIRQGSKFRQEELEGVAAQCRINEIFYHHLNEKLGRKLLLPGYGSIIVARNEAERNDLMTQKENLTKEGRQFNILSHEEIAKRGLPFKGLAFGEKPHDRVLSPAYKRLLTNYIKENGGKVINGALQTVYTDGQQAGGMVKYQAEGREQKLRFEQLFMSLGNQEIRDLNNRPLFDVIGATGSSGLALLFTPPQFKLPRAAVFGETNHVTVLSSAPVTTNYEGKTCNVSAIRFTAGACVTPAHRGDEGANYDATISLGLVNSLYKTYNDQCTVVPLTVYGCNRVVSQRGQTSWLHPYPGIQLQFGAGGGGLTRGVDLATKLVQGSSAASMLTPPAQTPEPTARSSSRTL